MLIPFYKSFADPLKNHTDVKLIPFYKSFADHLKNHTDVLLIPFYKSFADPLKNHTNVMLIRLYYEYPVELHVTFDQLLFPPLVHFKSPILGTQNKNFKPCTGLTSISNEDWNPYLVDANAALH